MRMKDSRIEPGRTGPHARLAAMRANLS